MWIRPDGAEFADEDWADPENRTLGMLIPGRATDEVSERGHPIYGDTVLLLMNAGSRSRHFQLPVQERAGTWREMVNTARSEIERTVRRPGLNLVAHSLILLRFEEADRHGGGNGA
jgi:pullulanase/glycogen debranching enzyme